MENKNFNRTEENKFSKEQRLEFFTNLHNDNKEPFTNLDKDDFLRFAGIPNEIIVEEINQVPFEKRLKKSREMGLITTIQGKSWSYVNHDRPIIFTKVGGENIPFYRSSVGTGGHKEAGIWYPFFGFAKKWLIKGGGDNYKTCYDNPVLKKIQDILGNTFNWDHKLDFIEEENFKNHPLKKDGSGDEIFCPAEQMNDILYNKSLEEFDFNNQNSGHREWIENTLARMYEKYPIDFVNKVIIYNKEKLKQLGYLIEKSN